MAFDGALIGGLLILAGFGLGLSAGIGFGLGFALGSRRARRDMIDGE